MCAVVKVARETTFYPPLVVRAQDMGFTLKLLVLTYKIGYTIHLFFCGSQEQSLFSLRSGAKKEQVFFKPDFISVKSCYYLCAFCLVVYVATEEAP